MKDNDSTLIKYKVNRRQSSVWLKISKTLNTVIFLRGLAKNSPNKNDEKWQLDIVYVVINFLNTLVFKSYSLMKNPITVSLLLPITITSVHAASVERTDQRVLMIEMTPALCSMQSSRARMRQCLEGYSFTVSGLDIGYDQNCGRTSSPRLTPLQLKVVNRVMPDTTVRSQVWQRYGACSPLSANNYFRQIVNYAGQLKIPNELSTGNSYTVSKSSFVRQMTRLNKGMTPSSIDLICQAGSRRQSILTEVHICYEGAGFGNCSNVTNSCDKKFILSGGN